MSLKISFWTPKIEFVNHMHTSVLKNGPSTKQNGFKNYVALKYSPLLSFQKKKLGPQTPGTRFYSPAKILDKFAIMAIFTKWWRYIFFKQYHCFTPQQLSTLDSTKMLCLRPTIYKMFHIFFRADPLIISFYYIRWCCLDIQYIFYYESAQLFYFL